MFPEIITGASFLYVMFLLLLCKKTLSLNVLIFKYSVLLMVSEFNTMCFHHIRPQRLSLLTEFNLCCLYTPGSAAIHEYNGSVRSGKHCFTPVFHNLWLLRSSTPSLLWWSLRHVGVGGDELDVPFVGWALHGHYLFSVFWPLLSF